MRIKLRLYFFVATSVFLSLNDIKAQSINKEVIFNYDTIWEDASGKYKFELKTHKEGRLYEASWKMELYGSLYKKIENNWVEYVKVYDFSPNSYSFVYIEKEYIKIMDIDNDGDLEIIFIYLMDTDGYDPIIMKQILVIDMKKLPIRGILPRQHGDENLYKKVFDPIFNSYPPSIKSYASQHWDNFVKIVEID